MKLSIVLPVWNEEDVLPELWRRLESVLDNLPLGLEAQVVFADDGSLDGTAGFLEDICQKDPRVVHVRLSRNYGHQACLMAGLSEADGDFVVMLDGDLEDPPELIPQFLAMALAGSDVVIGARIERKDRWWRKLLFSAFHQLLRLLSDFPIQQNTGTACLLSKRAVHNLLAMEERNRFLPGLRSWIGFKTSMVAYSREGRYAGTPKQDFGRLLRYAMDAIFSFSYKPLRLSLYLGCTTWMISMLYAFTLVVQRLLNFNVVKGFTTTTVLVLFFGGTILISVGILGEYLGRIYDEVKRRPMYIVSSIRGRNKGVG